MDKIPTAEEMEQSGKYDDYSSMMIDFAKLHVKAALEIAAKKAKYIYTPPSNAFGSEIYIDKDSILNAYPESNIQ